MYSKENINSSLSTKYIRSDGFRRLSDVSNQEQFKQSYKIPKRSSITTTYKNQGRLPDIKLEDPNTQSLVAYPCYNEKYLRIPQEMATKLKKRNQDDDCDTDEEVLDHSVNHNITEILKTLSFINQKAYNKLDYFL